VAHVIWTIVKLDVWITMGYVTEGAVWMTFFFLVGLESANLLVLTLTVRILLLLLMQVILLSSVDEELIYQ